MKSMVDLSHDFLLKSLHKQAVCIDATLGHGNDTRFFLEQGVRKVYAYEIQTEIFNQTIKDIDDPRLHACNQSHETMEAILEPIDAIVFNFGYCPHGKKEITTVSKTSLKAVRTGIQKLKPKGRMALVFYPHEQGKEEAKEIEAYLQTQKNIDCIRIKRMFIDAPYMIGVEKRR